MQDEIINTDMIVRADYYDGAVTITINNQPVFGDN